MGAEEADNHQQVTWRHPALGSLGARWGRSSMKSSSLMAKKIRPYYIRLGDFRS